MGSMSPLQSRENMAQGNLRTRTGVVSKGKTVYDKEDEMKAEVSDKRKGSRIKCAGTSVFEWWEAYLEARMGKPN